MECIEGPLKGYYIAAYAGPSGARDGYVGYVKVCRSRPVSYWESDCLLKDGIGLAMRTPQQALDAALDLAKHQVDSLPPVDELPVSYRTRPIPSHKRLALGLLGA